MTNQIMSLILRLHLSLIITLFAFTTVNGQLAGYNMRPENFGLDEIKFHTVLFLDNHAYMISQDQKKLWTYDLDTKVCELLLTSRSILFLGGQPTKFNDWTMIPIYCSSGHSLIKTKNTFSTTEKIFDLPYHFLDTSYELIAYKNHLYVSDTRSLKIFRIDSSFTEMELFIDMSEFGDTDDILNRRYFIYNSILHFYAYINGSDTVWKTDGDKDNIVPIIEAGGDMIRGIRDLWFTNDLMYISAKDGQPRTWVYDGKSSDAEIFKDVDLRMFFGSAEHSNGMIMNGFDDLHLSEPWIFDGTQDGTHILRDIRIDGNSSPLDFRKLNESVNFTSFNSERGLRELYESDGTPEGTINVASRKSFGSSAIVGSRQFHISNIDDRIVLDEYLGGGEFNEIKIFDGDLYAGADQFASIYDEFFFVHFKEPGAEGFINWVSDGTVENTIPSPYSLNHGRIERVLENDDQFFEATVIDSSDFYETDVCFEEIQTSNNEYTIDDSFILYPNPVNGELNITMSNPGQYRFQLTDAKGKIIITKELQSNNSIVSLRAFPAGLYFAIVTDIENNSVTAKKIVKSD